MDPAADRPPSAPRDLKMAVTICAAFVIAASLASLPYVWFLCNQRTCDRNLSQLWVWPLAMSKLIAETSALAVLVVALSVRGRLAEGLRTAIIAQFLAGLLAQYFALWFGGDLLTGAIVAQAELAWIYVRPWTVLTTLVVVGVLPVAYACLARRFSLIFRSRRGYVGGVVAALAIFGAIRVLANFSPWALLAQQKIPLARSGHIQKLASAAMEALNPSTANPTTLKVELDEADLKVAAAFGIQVDPKGTYPFLKTWYAHAPLPYTRLNSATPNVILIFAESLSARMTSPYNPDLAMVTPNIATFASESTIVRGLYNHTFPTVTGTLGQLCSSHPNLGHYDWAEAKFKLKIPKALCLPQILKDHGFDTSFFGPTAPAEMFVKEQIVETGFHQALFFDDLLARYLPNETPRRLGFISGGYGNSDRQMFASTMQYLQERPAGDNPFFLTVSTLETHPGMDVIDGIKFGQGNDILLNRVANFDHQFGVFADFLRRSPYAQNTIVILTADHAHAPGAELAAVNQTGAKLSVFDEITFIIHDPIHALPPVFRTHGTSIDLAPTILQLLDIPPMANSFLGLSLFTDRPNSAGGLGLVFGNKLLINDASAPEILEMSLTDCAEAAETRSEPCKLFRTLHYAHQVMAADRLWSR